MRGETITLPLKPQTADQPDARTAGQPFADWSFGLPGNQRPTFGPARILAAFDHGWVLLTDAIIGTDPPAPIDLVLLHPQIGVALLEVAPHWSRHAPAQFRHRLDQARFGAIFPGHLPVVHRMLRPAELEALPRLLAEAFAGQPPLTLPGGDAWAHAVRRALLARPMAAPELPLPPMLRPGRARRGRLAAGLAGAAAFGLLVVAMLPDLPAGRRGEKTAEARPDSTAITTAALGEIRTMAFAAGEDRAAEPGQSMDPASPGQDSPDQAAPPALMQPPAAPSEAAAAPAVPVPAAPPPTPPKSVPAPAPPPPAVPSAVPRAAPGATPVATPQPGPSPAPTAPDPALIPAAPPIVRPPPPPAARPAADPALLLALLRRGEALLAIGDVSGARRFFERAADAGSAAGARAAGRTYDPEVLAALGAWGIRPDPMAASAWYHRARELEQQAPAHTETAR